MIATAHGDRDTKFLERDEEASRKSGRALVYRSFTLHTVNFFRKGLPILALQLSHKHSGCPRGDHASSTAAFSQKVILGAHDHNPNNPYSEGRIL